MSGFCIFEQLSKEMPQNDCVVYGKDLSNSNFEGLHIEPFMDFTGANICGTRFSDDDDIKTQLCSINSANRISNVLKVGYYKNIAFEDYKTIKKQSSTTGLFPMYLEK